MQLYSTEELPLQKYKNKYVVDKNELLKWTAQKEKEEEEKRKRAKIFNCVATVILLIMIIGLVVFFKSVV
jgi:hypothetical protein